MTGLVPSYHMLWLIHAEVHIGPKELHLSVRTPSHRKCNTQLQLDLCHRCNMTGSFNPHMGCYRMWQQDDAVVLLFPIWHQVGILAQMQLEAWMKALFESLTFLFTKIFIIEDDCTLPQWPCVKHNNDNKDWTGKEGDASELFFLRMIITIYVESGLTGPGRYLVSFHYAKLALAANSLFAIFVAPDC